MKTIASGVLGVLLLLVVSGMGIAQEQNEAEAASGYDQHGPVACVDGVIQTTFGGRAYDSSGVTGVGTQEDPFVLVGVQINMTGIAAVARYDEAILIQNCPHFRLTEVQLYGDLGYEVVCYEGLSLPTNSTPAFGVRVIDSSDVVIDNSVLKYARWAAVNASGESTHVKVVRSDIKANFGGGVWARFGARVNVTESFISYNGYGPIERDDPYLEFYEKVWPNRSQFVWDGRYPVVNQGVGLWADQGGFMEAWNDTMFQNKNHWVVDQSRNASSDGVFNGLSLENTGGYNGLVMTAADPQPGYGGREPWACNRGERMHWYWEHWGPEPRASASMGGYPEYVRTASDEAERLFKDTPIGSQHNAWLNASVVEGRLTFWGTVYGPQDLAYGPIDTLAWLNHRPPYALLAGAARSQGQEGTLRDVGMAIDHAN